MKTALAIIALATFFGAVRGPDVGLLLAILSLPVAGIAELLFNL